MQDLVEWFAPGSTRGGTAAWQSCVRLTWIPLSRSLNHLSRSRMRASMVTINLLRPIEGMWNVMPSWMKATVCVAFALPKSVTDSNDDCMEENNKCWYIFWKYIMNIYQNYELVCTKCWVTTLHEVYTLALIQGFMPFWEKILLCAVGQPDVWWNLSGFGEYRIDSRLWPNFWRGQGVYLTFQHTTVYINYTIVFESIWSPASWWCEQFFQRHDRIPELTCLVVLCLDFLF